MRNGSFAEVRLESKRLGWRGTADLLTVFDSGCEIADFKTGQPSDDHAFQLHVYALLWRHDVELNPKGTSAQKLVISYAATDVDVPIQNVRETQEFETKLLERTAEARARVALSPPPAAPSAKNCAHCSVRHLCREYWGDTSIRQAYPLAKDETYEDIELELLEPEGPGMWTARILASASFERDCVAKLQLGAEHSDFARRRRRIRILGARVLNVEDEDLRKRQTLIGLSAWTEVFLVDDEP